MDHFSYPGSSAIPGSHHPHQQPLTPISNLTSHPSYHQESPGHANTLPPLNGHAAHPNATSSYQQPPSYKAIHSDPHAPRAPHTPDTPGHAEHHSLPHLAPQPHMNVAEPHVQTYAPASYTYQETSPASYHSPAQQQNGFPHHVMPHYTQPPVSHISPTVQSFYDRQEPQPMYSYGQPPQVDAGARQSDPRPMPVVGSQGRRGILPSASGRAPPVGSAPDGSMRGVTQPAKNGENKFPCQYCNKTYLHLKHLKRHHLRHTGERPYQCSLCHETFCRSDILKRHFSKCAIRRGNPTNATHLTHAQAHLQKSNRSAPNSSNGTSAPPPLSGLTSIQTGGFNAAGHGQPWSAITARSSASTSLDQNQISSSINESARTSRSSSLTGPENNGDDVRKRYSAGTNLAPMNGNVESHADNHASERPFSYPLTGDHRQVSSGQQMNGFFAAPPSTAPHNEHLPPMNGYMRAANGWPHAQYNTSHPETHQQNWTHCFAPGGQDTLMYNGQ